MATPNTPEQIFELLWEDKKRLQNKINRLKVAQQYLIHYAWVHTRHDGRFETPQDLADYVNNEIDLIDSERNN